MTDLRVLQLLPALGDGGVERSAVEMARSLGERGDVALVASAGGVLVPELEEAGARHFAIRVGAKSPLAILSNARRLAALIDAEKVDIVHARSRAPAWAGWLAVRRSTRKPAFVTTFHGTYGHGSALKRWYNGVMLRGPLVIANSAFIRDHIVSVYGVDPARIVVAPRGVDTDVFDPARMDDEIVGVLREEFAVPIGAATILLVARLTRWKGHAVAIEAMARLRDVPAVLVFAGGGEEDFAEELQALADAQGVAGRIRFAGSRRDVPELLKSADLALAPSIEPEAFGRAAVEAMAMETPVIATAHGGSLETVLPGETGWLVPPGDAEALAESIRIALADPVRLARMGRMGRIHVLRHFTSERTVEAEYGAYLRLLAGEAGNPRR